MNNLFFSLQRCNHCKKEFTVHDEEVFRTDGTPATDLLMDSQLFYTSNNRFYAKCPFCKTKTEVIPVSRLKTKNTILGIAIGGIIAMVIFYIFVFILLSSSYPT